MTIAYSIRAARRITWTLFIVQSLGSAALIANSTVNPIIGAELSGRDVLAGLPGTVLLLGAAAAAQPAGRLMQRVGRRWGLALGFFIGAFGMIVSGSAIIGHSFLFFLLGLLLIGGARGAIDQSRYAAADAQLPTRRARAISTVVFAGTIGAIVGPQLVGPTSNLLGGLGGPPLAGPMWSGTLLFALAGFLIIASLRPDPRDIAQAIARLHPEQQHSTGPARSVGTIMRQPQTQIALAAMVTGQMVMVLIMGVTSLHMHHNQHSLHDVGMVLMAHTLGMYGLSIVTGPLADRIGRPLMIAGGALFLIAGSLLAPYSLMTSWLAVALFLIGLGWNLCYIAGSSLLADLLAPSERGSVQGVTELVVNVAAATSSLGSGVILARFGYGTLSLIGVALASIPLILLGWQRLAQSVQRVRLPQSSSTTPALLPAGAGKTERSRRR